MSCRSLRSFLKVSGRLRTGFNIADHGR
eukprot:COSAG01_NODE_72921_length_251_cov_1.697368_1_plen_27_part_01